MKRAKPTPSFELVDMMDACIALARSNGSNDQAAQRRARGNASASRRAEQIRSTQLLKRSDVRCERATHGGGRPRRKGAGPLADRSHGSNSEPHASNIFPVFDPRFH